MRRICNDRVVLLQATTTTDDLAAVITTDFGGIIPWPLDPDQPAPPSDAPAVIGEIGSLQNGATSGDALSDVTSVDGGAGSDTIGLS